MRPLLVVMPAHATRARRIAQPCGPRPDMVASRRMEPVAFTSAQAEFQLIDLIDRCGGEFRDWYLGMTNNPEHMLFNYHLVDNRDGQYFYCRMTTYHEARFMLEHMLN